MKRKYRNLAVSLAALNFLSIGVNANDNLRSNTNKKETIGASTRKSDNTENSKIDDEKDKNNSKNSKLKTKKRSKSFAGNLGENGKSLATAVGGAAVVPPILRSLSYLGKKIFFSKSRYYLANTHIKASNWKKVENIIMSSTYSYLVSSNKLWNAALEKLQRQFTGCINGQNSVINFESLKNKKISELQYEFSKEINEFRKFIFNRFYQKKDSVPPNSNQVYEGVSEAKNVRTALDLHKSGLNTNDAKNKFDKDEKEIIAWLLIAFVDDSAVTNLTYDQLINSEDGKKIINAIISGQEN